MAETQNITLSIPRDVLKRVKRLAADRDTSVSALMVEALSRLSDADRRYAAADANIRLRPRLSLLKSLAPQRNADAHGVP